MGNLWGVNFTLDIGGDILDDEVVSMHFKTSLCNPIGQLDITVNPNIPYTIQPYEDVVITIDGTKVFTGHTQNITKARMPYSQTIICHDAMAKVTDTYITDIIESQGIGSVGYWINRFLALCQVEYEAPGSGPNVGERSWAYVSCKDAIYELIKLENWHITVDEDNRIHVSGHSVDADDYWMLDEIQYFERYKSDDYLRNKIVVIGNTAESSVEFYQDIPELGNEIRAGVIAGDIYWPGTAYAIAARLAHEFSQPTDHVTVEIEGNPEIRIGQTGRVIEPWSNTDMLALITTLEWSISEETGYTNTLVLNERCPSFWTTDAEPIILYCATEGWGVWKSFDDGKNWFDISGQQLKHGKGLPSYAKDIHVIKQESILGTDDIVWAATLGGLWKTDTGAPPWTEMSENMDARGQAMQWWGVKTDPLDKKKVYAVGNYASSQVWLYYSLNEGEDWSSHRITVYEE